MKIIFLFPDMNVCGGRYHLLEVARQLMIFGHDVRIISPKFSQKDLAIFYDAYPVPIIVDDRVTTHMSYLPSFRRPLAVLRALWSFWKSRYFCEHIPADTDVIYAGFYTTAPAALLAKRKQARNAITVLSIQMPPRRDLWDTLLLLGRLYAPLPRLMDALITVSECTSHSIKTDLGLPSFNVCNGIDQSLFRFVSDNRDAISAFNLPSGKDFLLFLGGIHQIKGIEYLLPAFKKLSLKYHKLHLILAGSSPYIDKYKKDADNLGIANKISWTGYVKRDTLMPKLYSLASVFVFPSLYESFAIPPLEAMACRCPVAVSDCGGPSEYLENGRNGVVFPIENIDAIVSAVSYLLDNPAKAAELAAEGEKTAQKFSWEAVARKTEAAFLQSIKKARGE